MRLVDLDMALCCAPSAHCPRNDGLRPGPCEGVINARNPASLGPETLFDQQPTITFVTISSPRVPIQRATHPPHHLEPPRTRTRAPGNRTSAGSRTSAGQPNKCRAAEQVRGPNKCKAAEQVRGSRQVQPSRQAETHGARPAGHPCLRAARGGGAPELRRCAIPRERPTPRRLDFEEPVPKRPRTDRVRVGYIVRHPRPPTGDLCQRLRMRITVDGNERGTISGTIVYLRRLRAGANLHRALYEHRQATHDLHEVGLVLWTASGRARDDILEASASARPGARGSTPRPRCGRRPRGRGPGATLRRCGCAAATHVARPALHGRGAARGRVVRRGRYREPRGGPRGRRLLPERADPEALWVVTQETLYHDAAARPTQWPRASGARTAGQRNGSRGGPSCPQRPGLRNALGPRPEPARRGRRAVYGGCERVHDQGATRTRRARSRRRGAQVAAWWRASHDRGPDPNVA